MLDFVRWYLYLTALGLLTFPLAYRFLPWLADRGYAVSRALGMLLWGFTFWLLASLHILQNDLGGEIFALLVLAGLSAASVLSGQWREVLAWLKVHWKTVVVVEALFLVAFGCWALVRASNPNISGTEKPMELAFINAILKSPSFPPSDPWLSGYSISYYYFGYVMIAMLCRITAVYSGVGFNLAAALWYSMTALGAYGVVYNLIALWKSNHSDQKNDSGKSIPGLFGALLGPFFILIVSNIEGFLEMLSAGGLFWTKAADGTLQSSFWSWLGILEINTAPTQPLVWMPTRYNWWWRASRVVTDYTASGTFKEVIDEFPGFSYLLADMHPHVLGMPFVMLAISFALNLYIWGQSKRVEGIQLWDWIQRPAFWLTAIAFGGLAFMNTWDFPFYVALISGVYALVRYQQNGWSWRRLLEFVEYAAVIGIAGALLYFPFYVGFSSQAGGLIPSMVFFTRGVQFWVMFAPLLVPIFMFLIYLFHQRRQKGSLATGLKFAGLIVGGLWLLSYLFGGLLLLFPLLGDILAQGNGILAAIGNKLVEAGNAFLGVQEAASSSSLIVDTFVHRLTSPGTWLTLFALIALAWAIISTLHKKDAVESADIGGDDLTQHFNRSGLPFILALILLGAGLTLMPEFFFLRDQFGDRMNTIFKFYFQGWITWGLAAAFASYVLWNEARTKKWRMGFAVAWLAVIAAALVYIVFGLNTFTNGFNPGTLNLDGTTFYSADELAAVDWLDSAPYGVVTESIGGSYSAYARVSELSGLPTVLGWVGHESQWRGGGAEMGNRQADIELLYRTNDWPTALNILQKYDIRYVYVGDLERSTYHVVESKFQEHLSVAYQNISVTIYQVPDDLLQTSTSTP
jgi:YYY domain-containing protein